MRPATSLQADGPQNLLDAVTVARVPGARGVLAVLAGRVHAGNEVRKSHSYRLDAFAGGDAGPIAVVEEGRIRRFRPWPEGQALGLQALGADPSGWPWVAIVMSHAGADGKMVDALAGAGVRGLVLAGSGNGTVHLDLQAGLLRAVARGVPVVRVSRCAFGGIVGSADSPFPALPELSAAQARIALMLQLLVNPQRPVQGAAPAPQ